MYGMCMYVRIKRHFARHIHAVLHRLYMYMCITYTGTQTRPPIHKTTGIHKTYPYTRPPIHVCRPPVCKYHLHTRHCITMRPYKHTHRRNTIHTHRVCTHTYNVCTFIHTDHHSHTQDHQWFVHKSLVYGSCHTQVVLCMGDMTHTIHKYTPIHRPPIHKTTHTQTHIRTAYKHTHIRNISYTHTHTHTYIQTHTYAYIHT